MIAVTSKDQDNKLLKYLFAKVNFTGFDVSSVKLVS